MLDAVNKDEADKFKAHQQLIAWQTSLLMNATGNYKKQIKPSDLLPKEEEKPDGKGVNRLDRDEKNKRLEDLMNKFEKPLAE